MYTPYDSQRLELHGSTLLPLFFFYSTNKQRTHNEQPEDVYLIHTKAETRAHIIALAKAGQVFLFHRWLRFVTHKYIYF